jgi:hypothetical protein
MIQFNIILVWSLRLASDLISSGIPAVLYPLLDVTDQIRPLGRLGTDCSPWGLGVVQSRVIHGASRLAPCAAA